MSESSPQSSLVLHASGYRRMRWKNGAGWTSEILKVHGSDDRTPMTGLALSIAEIEADAPFSAFPAWIANWSCSAARPALRFDDGDVHDLLRRTTAALRR